MITCFIPFNILSDVNNILILTDDIVCFALCFDEVYQTLIQQFILSSVIFSSQR